jgi:hypothetical protein
MQQVNKRILINFSDFAAFLGVSVRKVFKHRAAMRKLGVIETHCVQGRLYTVSCPDALNTYWKARSFE